ncbi:jg2024 [Pararge aegeria aegeria]|uniref:Jg2024 protein n=1 Tax=Pararge aegeria aegeria TaxID=348720 RepID=A0A8S4R554_9NEOP|nr:jg2024 [Pararge aegeria aegeria]
MPRSCSASEMFADARVDDFYAIIRKRAASMLSRLGSSTNILLSTLACRLDSSLWGCWDGVHTRYRSGSVRLKGLGKEL